MLVPRLSCLGIMVLVSAAACESSVVVTPVHPAPHVMASRPTRTVEVFRDNWPTSRYVTVDKLVAGDGSSVSDQSDLEARLLSRSSTLGCDGLIIEKVERASNAAPDGHVTRVTANCIVYKDAAGSEGNNLPGPR